MVLIIEYINFKLNLLCCERYFYHSPVQNIHLHLTQKKSDRGGEGEGEGGGGGGGGKNL